MKKSIDKFLEVRSIVDIEGMAASLANGDADEQALFLMVFFKALKLNCEDVYRFNIQLTYIRQEIEEKYNIESNIFFSGIDILTKQEG